MTEPVMEYHATLVARPPNREAPGPLHWAFMEWLRDYEILDTGRWEGLSVEAADALCEHYWLKFRANLEDVQP